jgi:hypothetical protein
MNAPTKTIRTPQWGALAGNGGQQCRDRRVIAKCLADMGETVDIAGAKNEACAELERIFAELVLAMAGRVGTFARDSVIAAQQVKQVCAP